MVAYVTFLLFTASVIITVPAHDEKFVQSVKGNVTNSIHSAGSLTNGTYPKSKEMDALLTALGTSICVRECTRFFGQASAEFFEFNRVVKHVEKMCLAYKEAKKCIAKSNCDGADILDGTLKGLEYLCVTSYSSIQFMKPCLEAHADYALKSCNDVCSFSMTLKELLKRQDVKDLIEEDGNELVLLEYLGPTCETFTCFLACVQLRLNRRCISMGTLFVETALKPIEETVDMFRKSGLFDMVIGHVPPECRSFTKPVEMNYLKYLGINPLTKKAVLI